MGNAERKAKKRLQNLRREHGIPIAEYSKPVSDAPRVPPPVVAKARGKAYRARMRRTRDAALRAGRRLSLPDVTKAMNEVDAELDGE